MWGSSGYCWEVYLISGHFPHRWCLNPFIKRTLCETLQYFTAVYSNGHAVSYEQDAVDDQTIELVLNSKRRSLAP